MSMNKTPAELRRAGKSWGDIARAFSVSVPEAKSMAAEEKAESRKEMAHSNRNEQARGLLDLCYCDHPRKSHENNTGSCAECLANTEEPYDCPEFKKPTKARYRPDSWSPEYAEYEKTLRIPIGLRTAIVHGLRKNGADKPNFNTASERVWRRRRNRKNLPLW